MSNFFQIVGVSKLLRRRPVLHDINLSVQKGDIWAVLGPSGAGKTTFLRIIAGFEKPEKGKVMLDGVELTHMPPHSRPINMVFQSYALFPHLTVAENVAFGLRFELSTPQKDKAKRVYETLDLLSLAELKGHYPKELSGGQKQRVALARCLVKRPKLLLLDEPFSALDKVLRERVQMEMRSILEHLSLTCICVTHDQQGALTLSTHMAILGNNTIQQAGRTEDVYRYPKTVYTARFLGDMNIFSGSVTGVRASYVDIEASEKWGRVYLKAQKLLKLGDSICFGVRPEAIVIAKEKPQKSYNCIQGVVTSKICRGKEVLYNLDCGKGVYVHVMTLPTAKDDIAKGDSVWAFWEDDAAVTLQL